MRNALRMEPPSPNRLLHRMLMLLAGVSVAASCSNAEIWSPPLESIVAPHLVSQLGESGEFSAPAVPSEAWPQLGYGGARRFAEAYVRSFGSTSKSLWSKDASVAIEPKDLRICSGPLFAKSAYTFGADDIPEALRNAVGGQFIVQYCDATGSARLLVSIAASATSLRIVQGGRLEFPREGAENSILAQGIQREFSGAPAIPPMREAMLLAAATTGRKIAAIPELVLAPIPSGALFARWRITLDEPVSVSTLRGGSVTGVTTVFVGNAVGHLLGTTVLVAAADEPSTSNEDLVQLPPTFGGSQHEFRLQRRVGVPRRVEPLRIDRGIRR